MLSVHLAKYKENPSWVSWICTHRKPTLASISISTVSSSYPNKKSIRTLLPWQHTKKPAFNGEISSENPKVISLLLATPFHLYNTVNTYTLYTSLRLLWWYDVVVVYVCRRWRNFAFGTNSKKQICAIVLMYTKAVILWRTCWKMLTENSFSIFISKRKQKHLTLCFPLSFFLCLYQNVFCLYVVRYEHIYYSMKLEIDFGALLFYTLGGLKWFPVQKNKNFVQFL